MTTNALHINGLAVIFAHDITAQPIAQVSEALWTLAQLSHRRAGRQYAEVTIAPNNEVHIAYGDITSTGPERAIATWQIGIDGARVKFVHQ
jgi:hypothetical protein